MATYEQLDLLIGQALESMNDAACEIKGILIPEQKEKLLQIGRSISLLWEVRNKIYEIKPELKRDFVNEYSDDKKRFEDLQKIHIKAIKAEKISDVESAILHYRELLNTSQFGYFKLLAEAGLYRTECKSKEKTNK